MLKYLFLFAFIPVLFFSQSHRFIYSYHYVPDSTNVAQTITENTRLDVFNDHSEFLSDVVAKKDSAIANIQKRNQSEADFVIPDGKYKGKTYKSSKLFYAVELVGIQPYKVLQNTKLNWKLTNQKKKIGDYLCQKATLKFGNRDWEAWFTGDIPFQEGPYVFKNLPGLIIKIKDTKNHHSFTLIENYKVASSKTNLDDKPYFVAAKTNKLKFNNIWNQFRQNPLGATEQFMIMNPGLLNGKSFDTNGNEIDTSQKKREEQKFAIKFMLENNNPIDLDLYKIK